MTGKFLANYGECTQAKWLGELPSLAPANRRKFASRPRFELMPMGIHWPDLDEDLGIAGMLQGRPAA
jgi:hypothetical protein